MGYYHFNKNFYIAILILSLSTLTNELTPSVHAQTVRTDTIRSNSKGEVNFLNRGRERFQRGDYKGAIADFNHALVLNPNDANVYYNRAVLLHELGDDLNAVSDFDRAIELNPRDANSYFHRAGARYGLGDQPGTIQDLQLAAKLFRAQGNTKGYQQAQNLIKQLQHSVE
ncbi:tetratricopeptide repeat protein [Aetokthonos hydrillicola Thurmond2011]|jgi:tetratricopeptide (TPR) repeat protein|uniref:Tetratricopeptide repeat protein n=1 Tax=Aetokthonos hydrillicola Thurmond2011 TaxID=2712845 RepID=A0AAP5I4N1_9CYAN|nr:tetratricopeptide repeat protein [Aetokthonos hydrillicola]MBO3458983.1 tetratricopeptide repeat protein [Aetokthonos hydrillicola CCALA 1050]MBW4589091.1 tetratricopeptide repeat protein [Aetokthonos hydrillicola CCALA 1050]MDR9894953.1 tetratricopeptide repeat protein [Aetokthonos hydrillicola Thurmond2011]